MACEQGRRRSLCQVRSSSSSWRAIDHVEIKKKKKKKKNSSSCNLDCDATRKSKQSPNNPPRRAFSSIRASSLILLAFVCLQTFRTAKCSTNVTQATNFQQPEVVLVGREPQDWPAHFQPASLFWTQNRTLTNFSHIQFDDNSIYLGATNWLLQLSLVDLRPEVALKTGPADQTTTSSRDCAPADCQAQLVRVELENLQGLFGHYLQRASSIRSRHHHHHHYNHHQQFPQQASASLQLINNYNKILAIDTEAKQLIVCGSLGQGACRKHQLSRLANFSEPIPSAVASNDEQSSTVAQVVRRESSPAALYVAATNSRLGPYREMVPAISARYLDPTSGRALQIIEHGFDYAKVDISFELRDYYLVNYVHSFAHNDFVYFVTVQRKSPLRQLEEFGYVTRLARLCLGDLSFQSYTELTLECRNPQRQDKNYNLLQAAHLAQVSAASKQANAKQGTFWLIGAFSQSRDHTTKSAKTSALCAYPMEQVERLFDENIQLCQNGTLKSRNMNYIAGSVGDCPRQASPTPTNVCNEPIKLNGSLPLIGQPLLTYEQELITAVSSTLAPTGPIGSSSSLNNANRQHLVLLAGTSDGQLKRIVVAQKQQQQQQYRASEFDTLQIGAQEAILQDLQIVHQEAHKSRAGRHAHHEYALLATQSRLAKVRINSCKAVNSSTGNLLDDCQACAQIQDPFCGWCSQTGSCVARDECPTQNVTAAQWLPFDAIRCHDYKPAAPAYLPLEWAGPEHDQQTGIDVNVRLSASIGNELQLLGAQLAGAHFTCHFDYLAHWPVNMSQPRPSGASTKARQARLSPQTRTIIINCPLPNASQRPSGEFGGELKVRLTIKLLSQALVHVEQALSVSSPAQSGHGGSTSAQGGEIERDITFYSCQQHANCRSCLTAGTGSYSCSWCPLSNKCTFNASHADFGCAASAVASTTPSSSQQQQGAVRPAHLLSASLDRAQASVLSLALSRLNQCPNESTSGGSDQTSSSASAAGRQATQQQQQQQELLVAHNSRRQLQILLRQPQVGAAAWRDRRVLKLECLLELEGAKARLAARLLDAGQILCQETLFAYQAEQATQRAQIQVILNEQQVLETSEVILYKCHLFGVNPPALASIVNPTGEQNRLHSSAAWRAHDLFSLVSPTQQTGSGEPSLNENSHQASSRQKSDCSLCANIERKFQCSWCSNQCQFREHCQEMAASTCPPPRIDSIHPNSGPLEGGTLLTIEGSNLGSNEREIQDKISVGGEPCQLLMYSVSTRIVCKTGPSLIGPQAATVFVGNRAGVTSAYEKFHYKAVHLNDVTPRMGPISGGTRLYLAGSNLNVGSRIQVLLDDIPCIVDSNETSSNQITCITSPNLASHSMRVSKLTLMVDNSSNHLPYPFQYQPDPIITQIEPSESFLAGGRLILVQGHHLASPQSTKMVLYHENKHNVINETTCITQNDTLITCLTPAITRDLVNNLLLSSSTIHGGGVDQQALEQQLSYEQGPGLRLKMMFLMDDVKSVRNLDEYYHHLPHFMSYFEDPKLFTLPLQVVEPGENLIIAGENLAMKQLDQDMLITIGIHVCPIKSLLANQVACEPPQKITPVYDDAGHLLDKALLPIVGLIGSNLRFQLGHMQYTSKHYHHQAQESSETSPSQSYINALAGLHQHQQQQQQQQHQSSRSHVLTSESSSAGTESNGLMLLMTLGVFGFVVAFVASFIFALARFRQSEAEREYKRIQLQMGSLDITPNGSGGGGGPNQTISSGNGLFYNKMQLPNFHQSPLINQQNLRSRALDYVGGALAGSFASSTNKSKPLYQFTNSGAQSQPPPLPASFPPSPLTDISSLIGSGASPARAQQQHVIKLNSDGTIRNASTNNSNHHYSLYGGGNTAATLSSSSSSSPGHNMFNSNNGNGIGNGNNQAQVNPTRQNYHWTQEAPTTIVPYAVIEACNLTLEGKNAIRDYV